MKTDLRYSEILGDLFYNIRLSSGAADQIDVHFTGAAHHLIRMREAKNSVDVVFHQRLHRTHLRALMGIVFNEGDFSHAIDRSGNGLESKSSWNPDTSVIPDEKMFDRMHADPRFEIGEAHVSDIYLEQVSVSDIKLVV